MNLSTTPQQLIISSTSYTHSLQSSSLYLLQYTTIQLPISLPSPSTTPFTIPPLHLPQHTYNTSIFSVQPFPFPTLLITPFPPPSPQRLTIPFSTQLPILPYPTPSPPHPPFPTHFNARHSIQKKGTKQPSMHLYHLTIRKPSAVQRAIYGDLFALLCDRPREFQFSESGRVCHFER